MGREHDRLKAGGLFLLHPPYCLACSVLDVVDGSIFPIDVDAVEVVG